MAYIKLPTKPVPGIMYKACYIKADDVSVNRYCTENSIGAHTYTKTAIPKTDDGAYYYQYYDSANSKWVQAYDYIQIVDTLNY